MAIKDTPSPRIDIESHVSDLLEGFLPAVLHLAEKQGIELAPGDEREIAVLSAQLRERVSLALRNAESGDEKKGRHPDAIVDRDQPLDS